MIIDTHAHLYFPELRNNISEILSNANVAGIGKIIIPAVDINTANIALDLASKFSQLYVAVGFHPCNIKEENESSLYEIETLCNNDKIVGIGEIGLDYYWDKSYIDKQKFFFRSQINIAINKNLPVIIHTRDSIEDSIEIVTEYSDILSGQFHCFAGNSNDIEKIITFPNFYISFCGNITYKNNTLADLLEKIPSNRFLSETDSPFLSPVPYRGRKNQPSYIVETIKFISSKIGLNYEELLNIMYGNAIKLFSRIQD